LVNILLHFYERQGEGSKSAITQHRRKTEVAACCTLEFG